MTGRDIIWLCVFGAVAAWGVVGFIYWVENPEMTQMQVFREMLGWLWF